MTKARRAAFPMSITTISAYPPITVSSMDRIQRPNGPRLLMTSLTKRARGGSVAGRSNRRS